MFVICIFGNWVFREVVLLDRTLVGVVGWSLIFEKLIF